MRKLLGELTYKSNWNGGNWLLDGEVLNLTKLVEDNKALFLANTPTETIDFSRMKTITTHGVDHDMGHEYSWSRLDPCIRVKTPFGKATINLYSLVNKEVKIYLFK